MGPFNYEAHHEGNPHAITTIPSNRYNRCYLTPIQSATKKKVVTAVRDRSLRFLRSVPLRFLRRLLKP